MGFRAPMLGDPADDQTQAQALCCKRASTGLESWPQEFQFSFFCWGVDGLKPDKNSPKTLHSPPCLPPRLVGGGGVGGRGGVSSICPADVWEP